MEGAARLFIALCERVVSSMFYVRFFLYILAATYEDGWLQIAIHWRWLEQGPGWICMWTTPSCRDGSCWGLLGIFIVHQAYAQVYRGVYDGKGMSGDDEEMHYDGPCKSTVGRG